MPELPWEIISYIVALLDRHTLTQAALINKDWNAACNRCLWSDLRSSALKDNLLFQGQPFQQGLDRNKRHIRNVRYVWDASLFLSLLLGVLPDLDLAILSCKLGSHKPLDDVTPLFLILEASSRLRTLRLGTLPLPIENAERLLLTIARCLPLLSTLDLFADVLVSVRPLVVREFLETCPQDLEILSLNINFCQHNFDSEEAKMLKEPVPGSKAHPNLKSFILPLQHNTDHTEMVEALVLEGFLRSCPALEAVFDCASVSLPRWSWMVDNLVIFNSIRGVVGDYRFARLVVNSSSPHLHVDSALAAEVSRYSLPQDGSQAYRNIYLDVSLHPSMELTGQALVVASKRGLQGLYIVDGKKFASNNIQSILHHGQSLRSFTSFHPPIVMAADVIQSRWACTWITILSIQIGGIPRPDIEFDALGKKIDAGTPLNSGTLEESRIIQRKVYSQLGALVSLQQLSLGNSPSTRSYIVDNTGVQGPVYYNPLFQTNCLEMSLASGLGLLGGVTALQSLDVSNMAHRIGEDELRWMESRWHSMRELVGLNREEVDAMWLGLYDPAIETVPCGHQFAIDPSLFSCNVDFTF
ncbi:hypothetical protein F5H01DRAFT_61098 [Linnemannia elongata]|nr:hypothetical protein F5H01DRAFT_61098 [Linnemannia elongata]